MRGCRPGARLALAALLLVTGCGLPPPSADVRFGGVARPVTPPMPGAAVGIDGLYVGIATAALGPYQTCIPQMPVTNFQVLGNVLSFGGFRGPVGFDGSVDIPYGGMWLYGHFAGPNFFGYIDPIVLPNGFEGCAYRINVQRAGG